MAYANIKTTKKTTNTKTVTRTRTRNKVKVESKSGKGGSTASSGKKRGNPNHCPVCGKFI